MNKHVLYIVAALLMATIVITACGGSAAPTSAPPTAATQPTTAPATTATQPTSAPSAGQTKLQLLGWSSSDAENELLKSIVADYNASQTQYAASFEPSPNYDQSLQTALAGGSPPDVFYIDSLKFPDFNKNDVLAVPPANAIQDPDDFYPSLKQAFTANGTFYCPPKDFSTLALIYNKTMLDAAGVTPPTTWDELKAASAKLTDSSKGVYGLSLSADAARFLAFLYQAGGTVIGEDGKMNINTPEAKTALDFYTTLLTDGSAVTPDKVDSGWNGEALGKEKVAMTVEGNWMVPFLDKDFPNVEYGIAELPAGPKGKATLAFTVCYAVPKNAKNAEGSWNLVNALTSKDGMKKWTDLGLAMPTRKSLREGWVQKFPNLKVFLDGADYSHPWEFAPGFTVVTDAINKGIQEIVAGQATSDAVLKTVQSAGEDVLGK
jgi:multiple sugar transport system substrate-binding protein